MAWKKTATQKNIKNNTFLKKTQTTVQWVSLSHADILAEYTQQDGRFFLKKARKFVWFPDLLWLQKTGYDVFINKYLHQLFADIDPVRDLAWENMYVSISEVKISDPIEPVEVCKRKEMTYGGIITGKVKLVDSNTKTTLFNKRANIWVLPLMTPSATYIINGIEKVIISQIVRSYGIFFSIRELKYGFKLIPERWPWLEVQVEKSWVVVARLNKSRKFPLTTLLRVFWLETDESIKQIFTDVIDEDDTDYVEITLKKDTTSDALSAAEFIYNKIRPGELVDPESALDYIKAQFIDPERINVWRIARRKINAKLWLQRSFDAPNANIFDLEDMVAAFKYLINLSNVKKWYYIDDADHLSNKRIRPMGEILYSHLQPVMRKFVKSIKGKLSILNTENPIKITDIVNFKIIDNSVKSFFATSQLAQFLDQINPLSEIEHKRRITSLWPGWLKRETAKFEVRDVHASHYGRICPIETPEWQNIWLVIYQALYSVVNEEWFLETPALKLFHEVAPKADNLLHRISRRPIYELDAKGKETKKMIIDEDQYIDEKTAKVIEKHYAKLKTTIKVQAFFTGEVDFISPEMDEKVYIADATTPLDDHNNLINKRVAGRHFDDMKVYHVSDMTHIDVNPSQIFSPNTSLIPFVNHNDAVRAAVATNQQRQALPLLKNDKPLVWTWLERDILAMTHAVIVADGAWEVIYVDGKRIKVKYKSGVKEYQLINFARSNHKTSLHQVPRVSLGQKVISWDILAEWPCAVDGEMALGKMLKVAFVPWEWYNYEDAIVISQRLVKDDELTSVQIEEYEIEVADTKLWPEETTNDIPGVSMQKLSNLDDDGIVRIGARVKWWDILVGKITPKSEWELSPEEKLIQAIFWDKSKNVKDTSLYMPAGSEWKVIDVLVLDAKKWDNLMAGVRKKIKVYVATTRKIEVWDKLAGKHGNKGIVAIVVPEEDMPFTEDGEPVDVCLNPLWVISRMNIWQLFESQLWYIAKKLWVHFAVPMFSWFGAEEIRHLAKKSWLPEDLKFSLYDGRTGQEYDQKVAIGYMHILKLVHMVEDKIHARSVWPYSLITQQPLWGKSRQWWQRFWEMEVWALEAYSAVYTLQEMLTVKSDDVIWRNKMYESIIKGQPIKIWWLPESFNLVTYLFKWLWQNVTTLTRDDLAIAHQERINKIVTLWLSGVMDSQMQDDENIIDMIDDTIDEKEEIIDNVIKEMEDFWDIE
jgi:DNA-directed RNA polymerase subunit beta